MRHADFAALPLIERTRLIDQADFPWPFDVLTVESNGSHTYAAIAIRNAAFGFVGECASLLVCPQNIERLHGQSTKFGGTLHLENGQYRMNAAEAIDSARHRAR